ncbi:MAG: zinc ribbon domain-containing protein [Actinobacteria bacterium]|nr:zinc ribbon domain-containing protein [Actinomycetota bacterium]
MPTPGHLRRERRALVRLREERIRDLGGLMLEMYRRDHFRQDLVVDHCTELTELERRLHELDSLLATTAVGRSMGGAARCVCGAPIIWGSHFCANCGRPVGDAPVVVCSQCDRPLPAEAHFCAHCGSRVEVAESPDTSARPIGEASPDSAEPERQPKHPVDSIER